MPQEYRLQELQSSLASIDRMMVGMVDWTETSAAIHAVGEASGGLDRGALITIIVVSIVAVITFVWIFRETRKRD